MVNFYNFFQFKSKISELDTEVLSIYEPNHPKN